MSVLASTVGFHDARLSVPAPAEGSVARRRITEQLHLTIGRHPVTVVTGAGGTGS